MADNNRRVCFSRFVLIAWIMYHTSAEGLTCSCNSGCSNSGITSPDGRKVNVAYGKNASISSVYSSAVYGTSGPACAAVNGRTDTQWVPVGNGSVNCIHTSEVPDGWWEVDLGLRYTVFNITVYRRFHREAGLSTRMADISVYVDDQICYSFPNSSDNTALNALPEKIDIICKAPLTGQVIRFQKHTKNSDGLYLTINICEVQIWVCNNGFYDDTCSQECGQCADSKPCDISTGHCEHCQDNYQMPFCKVCQDGYYGENCTQSCGHCVNQMICNNTDGYCRQCQSNFIPPLCKECVDGYYRDGDKCASCGYCADDESCHQVNGSCLNGCAEGYQGDRCQVDSKHTTVGTTQNTNLAGCIAGWLLSGELGIALIILLIVLFRLRRRTNKREGQNHNKPQTTSADLNTNNNQEELHSEVSLPGDSNVTDQSAQQEVHNYDRLEDPRDADAHAYSRPMFAVRNNPQENRTHEYINLANIQ